jgi:antibiotic biosynthesis monooxygenase (ABM) superfamily enzyme
MKNRKYKGVNKKEFKQIKALLEHFNIANTERVLKKMGNERCYATVKRVDDAKNFNEYLESVREETEKRIRQMKDQNGEKKKTKIDEH